ncbi:MAG TPA: carboxypeptidase-like regulatory domain-containing protein [Bryobacteraceae bacterium]|nr:carboxypeptidase-like regulatory domain-containing protein [Bryobacteraceae bacterium]
MNAFLAAMVNGALMSALVASAVSVTLRSVAAAAAESRSHLGRRVEMLLDKTRHGGTRLMKRRLAATLTVIAALALLVAKSPAMVAFRAPFVPGVAVRRAVRLLPKLPIAAQAAAVSQETNALAGRVVEDSTGNPLPSAELRFHQKGMRELAADLETDGDGRFGTSDLPPGDYTVDLLKPNFLTTTFKLHVPDTGVLLRLVRYGVIDGSAKDASGQPIPGRVLAPGGRTAGSARITVLVRTPGTEELRSFRETTLDDNGHFRVYDLPPGQYAIGLWYSGLAAGSGMQLYPDTAHPRFFTISGGEEYDDVGFTVLPSQSYSVGGRIELPAVKSSFQVALGLPEQPTLPIAQTLTNADGTFRFEKVPSGTYDLFASGPVGGYGAFDSVLGRGEPSFGRARVQVIGQDVEGISVPVGPGRPLSVALRAQGGGALPPGCPSTVSVSLDSLEPWAMRFFTNTQVAFGKPQIIRNLAPGRFRLTATGLGAGCYQASEPVVDLTSDMEKPVAIELAEAASIRGQLKGAPPSANFAVVLLDAGNTDAADAQLAFPDSGGRFTFDGLRPGRYRIAVQQRGETPVRWVADVSRMPEVDVAAGVISTVELPVDAKGGQQ